MATSENRRTILTKSEKTLQTDIAILEQRQKALEKEIGEALSHAPVDDPMIAYLKSRILFVKDEIDRPSSLPVFIHGAKPFNGQTNEPFLA